MTERRIATGQNAEPDSGRQERRELSEPVTLYDVSAGRGSSPCDTKRQLIQQTGLKPRDAVAHVRPRLRAIDDASAEDIIGQIAAAGAKVAIQGGSIDNE